jgi:hypothetical protein
MKYSLGVMVLAVVSYALWYFISPLFNVVEVDDVLPMAIAPEPIPSGIERLTPIERAVMDEQMAAANAAPSEPMTETMPTQAPVLSVVSEVMGTLGHPAEGTVRVIETENGPIIRYEDFKTINGPQLHVYLANDLDATEYVDLGPIRGTSGNINYTVPDGIDLDEYRYVLYWCVPFDVLFNYADLRAE